MHKRFKFDPRRMERDAIQAGFTQTALAKKVKASQAAISNFFTGKRGISPVVAKKLAKAIGQPLSRYVVERDRVSL